MVKDREEVADMAASSPDIKELLKESQFISDFTKHSNPHLQFKIAEEREHRLFNQSMTKTSTA